MHAPWETAVKTRQAPGMSLHTAEERARVDKDPLAGTHWAHLKQ